MMSKQKCDEIIDILENIWRYHASFGVVITTPVDRLTPLGDSGDHYCPRSNIFLNVV